MYNFFFNILQQAVCQAYRQTWPGRARLLFMSPTSLANHTPKPVKPASTARLVSQLRNVVLYIFKYLDKDKKEPVDVVGRERETVMRRTNRAGKLQLFTHLIIFLQPGHQKTHDLFHCREKIFINNYIERSYT